MSQKSAIPARIIIVDDHPLIRERLIELIDRESDLQFCGEAEDRHGALELVALHNPSLVIVDLTLKSSLGIELIKDLHVSYPCVKIMVVSMQDELIHAERCIRAGASGYINKQEASRHVIGALRKVLAGQVYLSESVTNQILARSLGKNHSDRIDSTIARLADRELQVFELIGKGYSTRQIADILVLDTKTVETYRSRIKEKLFLKQASELLQRAIAWVHHEA